MTTKARLRSTQVELDDGVEEITEYFYSRRMTDGLPIVPPTPERVSRMIEGAGRSASEVIAKVAPAYGAATIEKIAVNAVMAGCAPEYMPVIVAAVEAMCEPEFNLHGVQTCTGSVGPMLIVNGPIRQRLKINCGASVLGPGFKANATIGRSIRFIQLNIGGATPGDIDKSTTGWPGKFGCCIGENEEQSPWEPFHEERGFQRGESTVTVVGAEGSWQICDITPWPDQIALSLGYGMVRNPISTPHAPLPGEEHGSGPILLLNPVYAGMMAKLGYTKASFKQFLWETARYPAEWVPKHKTWVKPIDGKVPLTDDPSTWRVIVAGGDSGYHATAMHALQGSPITKRIRE